jgi:hypothetical protein
MKLQHLDLHSNRFNSAPAMASCSMLQTLDLSNNSLTALPLTLPPSLTHLYVNANPLNITAASLSQTLQGTTRLAALDVQFLNASLIFTPAGDHPNGDPECQVGPWGCKGPRITSPRTCRLGPKAKPCQWTIKLYDAWDQPCHVGGMAHNLSLGLDCHDGFDSCAHLADMVDQRDGSFLATVPKQGWIAKKGTKSFQFYHRGQEFKPVMAAANSGIIDVVGGGSCKEEDCDFNALRTVKFTPRNDCPPNAQADESGIECECMTGYQRENNDTLACQRQCHHGQVPGSNGTCICPSNSYDTSIVDVLLCAASEWSEPGPSAVSPRCEPCPECANCEDGQVKLKSGWRFAYDDFRTAFRCPYAELNDNSATCPSIVLPVVQSNQQPPCRGNHMGALCAVCQPQFTRHTSSNNRCERCSHDSYSKAMFGISTVWFVIVTLAAVLAVGCLLWFARQHIESLKALVWTHAKILLGWAQVISLLSGVLDIVYPPHARTALSAASLAVADLRGVVRLDCLGWTWRAKWFTLVFGMPGVLLLLIVGYFVYRHRTQHLTAKAEAVAACFFVAMLLYPQLSSTIFSALRCRRLGPTTSVLEVDYSIICTDASFLPMKVLAWILVLTVPVGFPLSLLALLGRRWSTQEAGADPDGHLRAMYGFCVDDYRPGCWYYEVCYAVCIATRV